MQRPRLDYRPLASIPMKANRVPLCGTSRALLDATLSSAVHGDAVPVSKPPLPSSWPAVHGRPPPPPQPPPPVAGSLYACAAAADQSNSLLSLK